MAFRMGLLGKKVGMTQSFDEKGTWGAFTVVQVGPCVVLDIKTVARDGYSAVKLAFDDKSAKRTRKPELGVFNKANTTPKRFVRELRLSPEETAQFSVGQVLSLDQVFRVGEVIDAIGTSRGKGFQGVMKRHNMAGFRNSHGTHEYFRHGGSIGCRLTPGRVHKGKRMGGQMGNVRVTIQNLRIKEIVADKNVLLLAGAVPGAPDGYVVIRHAAKRPPNPFALRTAAATPA